MTATNDRIARQFAFLNECDKLKSVDRANLIVDGSRCENSAEHSWHLALWALVFAPIASADVDIDRAIAMLLLHDVVEIDAGDHPIHLHFDAEAVEAAETAAATRIFGLLPDDQRDLFHALRDEFEARETPTAKYARNLDIAQPIFQTLLGQAAPVDHHQVVRDNLAGGRARPLAEDWSEAYDHALALMAGSPSAASTDFLARLGFLMEADKLKTVTRATRLHDNSRCENSAEHSWHIALHALVLAEHSTTPVDAATVVRMMILHDLVEIDAGDNPIHGTVDHAAQEAAELAAAERLYGILPKAEGNALRTLWLTFEAAQSPESLFGKAIDRTSAPLANMANGGGSWTQYNVTYNQLVARVGKTVSKGAPAVWAELDRQIRNYPLYRD